jgi:hypothetical protein
MADGEIFIPAHKYDESAGQFTAFDPGTRTLPVGFQFAKRYAPLTEELVFEKDTAVQLRDGTTIYTDVFRPVGEGPFRPSCRGAPTARRAARVGSTR